LHIYTPQGSTFHAAQSMLLLPIDPDVCINVPKVGNTFHAALVGFAKNVC
jgi:hypothetical protein